mmetsp:Transcript_9518/g.20003  ORF Transcript_9518/g.20003 Transcript_9518/m.20003 type:complete len:82 (+) Transcript_9518:1028-1273(+)
MLRKRSVRGFGVFDCFERGDGFDSGRVGGGFWTDEEVDHGKTLYYLTRGETASAMEGCSNLNKRCQSRIIFFLLKTDENFH